MKLVGRIPVEPLDEERLTNIERRLVVGVSELSAKPAHAPRSRHFAFAGAALAVAAAALIGWKFHGVPEVLPSATPTTIAVKTDTDHSMLDIGDATIESDPATAFAVTRPNGGVIVMMDHGKVELDVQKRHERPPLVVRAGDTDVEVVGTHFSVAWDGHGAVDVRVTEGTVRVKHQQLITLVEKGQEWTTGSGLVAIADTKAPGETDGPNEAVDHHGSDDIEIDTKNDAEVLHGRHAIAPDATGSAAIQSSAASQGSAAQGSAGPHGANAKSSSHSRFNLSKKDPHYSIKSAVLAQSPEPPSDVEGTTTSERVKNYLYLMNKTTGDSAGKAFYSLALTQHLEQNDDDLALRTLEGYFRRFEGGKFSRSDDYKAALWLRVRILCLRAIDDTCRQASYSFSKSGAEGPKAGIADQIAATQ
ncbi:MAG: hypothetical protein JWO36_5837 [Myxococcales bacterium]|nr:hypothetical protein [Myxococcales bacterium]